MIDPPPPARPSRIPLLLLLLAVLLGARLWPVLSLADVFVHGEELEKAAAGKAMLDGLDVAHHKLAYHAYEGGGFVTSHLDALAFLALGENLLAVKAVALLFNALILCAGFVLCDRAFGRASAVVFSLLFTFAPGVFQRNSLLALGIHFDALLFVLLILHFSMRILFEEGGARRAWIALGLCSGFGLYFSFSCAPAIAYAALAVLLARPASSRPADALWGLAAFALGAAPLLAMALVAGGEVLDIHGQSLLGGGERSSIEALREFLASVYRGAQPARLAVLALWPLAPLLALAALLTSRATRELAPRAFFLLGYLAVFALAYLASGFAVGEAYHWFAFHRLSQAWLMAVLLVTAGLGPQLLLGRGRRALALSVLGVLIAAGAWDTASVARSGCADSIAAGWSALRRAKGYAYEQYLARLEVRIEGDAAAKARVLLGFDESDPALLHAAIATALFEDGSRSPEEVLEIARGLGLERPETFLLGIGPAWRARLGGSIPERVAAAGELSDGLGPWVQEAVGRFGLGYLSTADRFEEELRLGVDQDLPEPYFRGLGYRLHGVRGDRRIEGYVDQVLSPMALCPKRAAALLRPLAEHHREPMLEGLQRARAEATLR